MNLKQFVLETLRHPNINRINFKYGSILVYPQGYHRDIASLVEDGHIQFDTGAGAHYTVDAQPGERHAMAVPAEFLEVSSSRTNAQAGAVAVKTHLGSLGNADFRGTIIHESTHALQDYQRHASDPFTAEGAAYLAGWMARLLWGYPRLTSPLSSTNRNANALARVLAARCLDGQIVYQIPEEDTRRLNQLVTTGSAHRYVFNGI